MTDLQIGILGLIALLLLIIFGMRVAYAVSFVGIIGMFIIKDWGAITQLIGYIPESEIGDFSFSAIPLFVLMGFFTYYAGIADDLFDTAKTWIGHIKGGLPIATVLASAGFAAVSGSSTASSSVMGKISIPHMLEDGVDKKLATGSVAIAGCLAALIPPSTTMIVYGILTDQSIAKMLIAGIIPGILTVLVYIILIYLRTVLNLKGAKKKESESWKNKFKSLRKTTGMLLLVILILGGIYYGFFTTTEAAGVGAFGALLIGLVMRKIKINDFKNALFETMKISSMIFLIMLGISFLTRFLSLSGATVFLTNMLESLTVAPIYIIIFMLFVYIILGMFMDALGMMMITLPIFTPVVINLGYDPLWFGILVIKMCEIGLVSPPVGLNTFVVKGVAPKVPLGDIFKGVVPFIAAEILVVAILILFPELTTFLPELMD